MPNDYRQKAGRYLRSSAFKKGGVRSSIKKTVHYPPKNPPKDGRSEPRRVVKMKRTVEVAFEPLVHESHQLSSNAQKTIILLGSLLDVSSKGLGLFTQEQIDIGTTVRVKIMDPRHPYSLIGTVVWCRKIPTTNVIFKTEPSMKFRLGLILTESTNDGDIVDYRKSLEQL